MSSAGEVSGAQHWVSPAVTKVAHHVLHECGCASGADGVNAMARSVRVHHVDPSRSLITCLARHTCQGPLTDSRRRRSDGASAEIRAGWMAMHISQSGLFLKVLVELGHGPLVHVRPGCGRLGELFTFHLQPLGAMLNSLLST